MRAHRTGLTGVVIGCETLDQLAANVAFFEEPLLSAEALAGIDAKSPRLPPGFLEIPAWPAGRRLATGEICQ